MQSKRARVQRRVESFRDCGPVRVEQLEARALLSAEVTPALGQTRSLAPTVMDWHGGRFTNVVQGSWIVSFRSEMSQAQAAARAGQVATALGVPALKIETTALGRFARIQTTGQVTEAAVAQARAQLPFLYNVEPEKLSSIQRIPNDAEYGQQWPHNNTGLALGNSPAGVTGADIKSERAWDISTGSRQIVVAVLDTGIDVNHPDLRNNLWRNPGEIPGNGIDDDANGFTDDVFGWDFAGGDQQQGDNNPTDPATQGHGTAVAGIIGAVGDNGFGVAGVNWVSSMMALKIFPDEGLAPQFAELGAYQYMTLMRRRGVNLVVANGSFGSLQPQTADQFSSASDIALRDFTDTGAIFVAAAGNDTNDNDSPTSRAYPASYDNPFIISVAATNNRDEITGFSNFGLTTVDLGAPGADTRTTQTGGGYQFIDGTSFASPYTAGVVALMASVNRFANQQTLRNNLLANLDPLPSLAGKTVTGGRLNALKAVQSVRVEGLFVTNISPSTQAAQVDRIIVEFSTEPDPAFFSTGAIGLLRANGASQFGTGSDTPVSINPANITLNGRLLTINLGSALARDLYRLTLDADAFRDSTGRRLNGDQTTGNDEVYDFNVVSFRGPLEPNDTIQTATPVILGSGGTAEFTELTIGDGLFTASDVDMFRVSVTGPSLITVTINARTLGIYSALDPVLRVFDGTGNQIATNDNFEGLDPKLQFFVPGAGQYFVGVSAFPNVNYLPATGGTGAPSGSSGTYSALFEISGAGNETIVRNGANTPAPIPALGEIVSTITVTDGRTVSDLTVQVNISHAFVGDLRVTLTGPGGQTVVLANRRGGNGANMAGTVFSDAAAAAIGSGVAPFNGAFRPEETLAPLKNAPGVGVWTLRISDLKPLDAGTLNSWSITFTTVNDISGPLELNDSTLLATPTGIDGSGARTFDAFIGDGAFGLRDVDLFRFTAGTGTTITATSRVSSGTLTTLLRLFDATGAEVRADARKGATENIITFVVANAGVYYVGVSGSTRAGGPTELGNAAYNPREAGSGTASEGTGGYSVTVSVSGGISEGALVLTGSRLSLGVSPNGAIGLPTGATPSGLALDGTDYLLRPRGTDGTPGAINSFYGATFDGFVIRNAADGSQSDLPVSVNNESDFANRRAVASGVFRSLGVRRSVSFGAGDQFAVVNVTLSNRSTLVINNVAWMEGLQGVQGVNTGEVTPSLTNNVRNAGRLAYSTVGGQETIAIGAPTGANVITTFRAAGTTRDPLQLINQPLDPDPSGADQGLLSQLDLGVAFNLGSLAPGQSVSVRYFILLGSTLGEVTALFNTMDTGAGAGHLVASPTSGANQAEALPFAIYYPEGYANSRASTFLPIVNASAEAVRIVVIARYEGTAASDVLYDSATDEPDGLVQPGKRAGITLTTPALYAQGDATRVRSEYAGRPGVRKDTPYSLEIRSSGPVGATMSHYDFGITTGQAATSRLSTTWTFAEVQRGAGINNFVVFYNPSTAPATVVFTAINSDGSTGVSFVTQVGPQRRGGFDIARINGLPTGSFGVRLDSDQRIVAAVTHFDSGRGAGYGAVGLPGNGATSGGTPQGQVGLTASQESLVILNPGAAPATVTVNFSFANASAYRRTFTVDPARVSTVRVDQLPGFPRGQPYSVSYTSTQPVTVSLPSYTSLGASGATLVSEASTQWMFGEGFFPVGSTAVKEYLRLFNPTATDLTVEIQISYNNGTGEVFRRTVPARATANYDFAEFITGTNATVGTVPGVGSFFGTRIVSSTPIVAFMGHFDSFLGGGFGFMGTALGSTGTAS
jgi:subtilisin family serine protease/subtilisin-like proprotein convertase family protein